MKVKEQFSRAGKSQVKEPRLLLTFLLISSQNQGVCLPVSSRRVTLLLFVFQIFSRQFITYPVDLTALAMIMRG